MSIWDLDIIRAVLSYVGCPDGNWKSSGEWLGPGEGLPLIEVTADVESGELGWCRVGAGPIIQHHSTRRWLLGCALD